jgi:hypothetical protein
MKTIHINRGAGGYFYASQKDLPGGLYLHKDGTWHKRTCRDENIGELIPWNIKFYPGYYKSIFSLLKVIHKHCPDTHIVLGKYFLQQC